MEKIQCVCLKKVAIPNFCVLQGGSREIEPMVRVTSILSNGYSVIMHYIDVMTVLKENIGCSVDTVRLKLSYGKSFLAIDFILT